MITIKPKSSHLILLSLIFCFRVETKLSSVIQLRNNIEANCHRPLRETLANHVFVGSISSTQALLQYSTKLYLCNTQDILEELFYQCIMFNFQNFDSYSFSNKISIYELGLIALDLPEAGWTEDLGEKTDLATKISTLLINKAPMLLDYFSMEIDTNGNLCNIPILLGKFIFDCYLSWLNQCLHFS